MINENIAEAAYLIKISLLVDQVKLLTGITYKETLHSCMDKVHETVQFL
jgi:hypothetical protein